MVQEVSGHGQREGADSGLGALLSRLQTHLKAAAAGEEVALCALDQAYSSLPPSSPLPPPPSPLPPLSSLLPLQLTTLELQYVSPKLMGCEDLELAVPGTYEPNEPIIHIRRVSATLNVITSKQRPRKLIIQGEGEREGGRWGRREGGRGWGSNEYAIWPHTHSLTHSLSHFLTDSLSHSLTHSLTEHRQQWQ